MARNEFTSGSDVDWALLIDGPADPQHFEIAQKLVPFFSDKPPGPTQVFGGPIFSHDLVHFIGGEADTNRNTTRRILLLLESRALVQATDVRERILRHLLRRYVGEDRGYHAIYGYDVRLPRFLLNDIVRYWRTMAVDYASKRRERGANGWAIRNIKLRLSRKLIFAAGLAMCMTAQLRPSERLREAKSEADFTEALQDFLLTFANCTPLQVVARFAMDFGADGTGAKLLDCYDQFLAVLADEGKRNRLKGLSVEEAARDPVFQEARKIGTEFQDGLTKLFFETDNDLTATIQRYGVF